jgi:hypothetical protein
MLALTLGGCAAGQGQDTDNAFPTAPPHSETGTPVTDGGGSTEVVTDGGTGGQSTSGNVTGQVDTSITTDPTGGGDSTGPVDPTSNPDPDCVDADADGFGENCQAGTDCDDNDYNNHTDAGCQGCKDADGDKVWVSCDQYGADKPGPDCDDNNMSVGAMDAVELCNGIAENCAGEIDPLPADEMCPTNGDAPNVAGLGGWKCNAVMPGGDGCEIVGCESNYYDANKMPDDGCECVGTDRAKSLDVCSADPKGNLGVVAEGGVLPPLKGVIGFVDNGPGNGMEDWFSVDFPEAMATGARPNTGNIVVTFAVNPGDPANPDYRFEVYRACDGVPFAGGLANVFGAGAPPAREWTFNDGAAMANPNYKSDIAWPEKVFIRVFRVNNSGSCSEYTLQVSRTPN